MRTFHVDDMDKLLTTKEVCEVARVKYPALNRWMKAGTFPLPVGGRKRERGRKLLWTQKAIETWMNPEVEPIGTPDQKSKEYRQRQEKAREVLRREHGIILPKKKSITSD